MCSKALNILKKMKEKREQLARTPIRDITYEDLDEKNMYCDEEKFLLKEVLRFIIENGRYPINSDFKAANGYPNCAIAYKYFNKSCGFEAGLVGAISCLHSFCDSRRLTVPKVEEIKKISYKEKYAFFNIIEKNLINKLNCQTTGKFKHKYRNVSCEEYGDIIFKFSSLNNNMWIFNLRKQIEDNQNINSFICIATDYNLTEIKYIWFIMNNKFSNIKNLTIYDTKNSLNKLNSYDITSTFNIKSLIS